MGSEPDRKGDGVQCETEQNAFTTQGKEEALRERERAKCVKSVFPTARR